jgi:hypothetical protein
MALLKHGDQVVLTSVYGCFTGTLHLPGDDEQVQAGVYGVHTLILPGGEKYRSEGRLRLVTSEED